MQAQEKVSEFIATKPGVQVLKASAVSAMADLAIRCDFPGLKSQILEFPITDSEKPLTAGRFTIQKSVDLPFDYDFLELKIVISGSIRVKDGDGVIHQADVGDVIVFTPPTSVVFLGDSEGEAVYMAHREQAPMFSKDGKSQPVLSTKPGIQLIKAGTPETIEVVPLVKLSDHKSQIIDLPISEASRPLSLGRFAMQPSIDFPFLYEYLEVKVILKGKICVKDEQGVKYEATPGDIYIFTPKSVVTFLAESDGEAIYAGHREQEPLFCL